MGQLTLRVKLGLHRGAYKIADMSHYIRLSCEQQQARAHAARQFDAEEASSYSSQPVCRVAV